MVKASTSIQSVELFRELGRNINALDKLNANCCGITTSQCLAIFEIGLATEISLNELADLLKLDNSTLSRTINQLVDKHVVTRTANASDRRYIKIRLTERGIILYNDMEEKVNSYFDRVMQSLPSNKRDQVLESLHLLQNAFNKTSCCSQEGN